ncbi:GlxA family transcriptional regulator [Roseovarius sp. LXJ103]|uniref:GlxA family transcriptional regulator n=1 Tax=Roseovarius carneus TaxID=2853164 RepID=UPI000D6174FE|nr:GlxA family transcriptional regulator [Roseovarius carneus]MBZ8119521.1 GlxA family transcriptional regulator [Roseovarius carneus]PWE34853.1 GlxA family transcriptional regulator [Pelagicola sp. LXJ1103]
MEHTSAGICKVTIFVTPHFNLAATAGFIDPFRAANYLDGASYFAWDYISERGGPVLASNGMEVRTKALSEVSAQRRDLVIVSTSWTPERHGSAGLRSALWRWARGGTTLGALDTGAFLLAQAGLLEGRRATVHYEHMDAFGEMFPRIELSEDICVFDGPRITCSGGAASMDFALHIIAGLKGNALANAAARYLFHQSVRPPGTAQNPAPLEPIGSAAPSPVRRAIALMEQHLEEPLSIADICARSGVSHRQMNRLFATHVKKTPALYYRDIRLDRARGLVTQTQMPMSQIALASGFASQVHFSRAYRARFGMPPRRDRVEGRVPFEFRAWPMHRAALARDGG